MVGAKMTASELADSLEGMTTGWFDDLTLTQSATMLRQQQAELEALRKSHIELERGIVKDLNQRQSAEPVAWMDYLEFTDVYDLNVSGRGVPLYTHPVKEQELLGEISQLKAELDTANKAYMWMDETYRGVLAELDLLKAHPVKEPSVCIGYWDYKTGAFHKILTESQKKRVDEGFLQPVYTAGMLRVKELTDEEIEECFAESCTDFKLLENGKTKGVVNIIDVGRAILRKAQEADKIESLGTINIGGVHYRNGKEVK